MGHAPVFYQQNTPVEIKIAETLRDLRFRGVLEISAITLS
jgi:hypothetical protein